LPNDRVVLEIEDTGVGMTPEVCARAFEPFFTTREGRGGTGLGLSTVHGIVTRFDGEISLHSTPGIGTRCRIVWPACKSSRSAALPEAPGSASSAPPTRILVVDDQVMLLRIVSRVLQEAGYQVVEATSVEEGLDRITQAEAPFDLVISDVRLGDGNGSEVTAAVREAWPSAQVLFMSGSRADSLFQSGVPTTQNSLIQKPFLPDQMLERVDSMIGTGGGVQQDAVRRDRGRADDRRRD
jgi:two-component system cell cycle sensor histidine kinase/response regulator CckA